MVIKWGNGRITLKSFEVKQMGKFTKDEIIEKARDLAKMIAETDEVDFFKKAEAKIYFYGGGKEGESMVPDMLKAYEEMGKVSKSVMTNLVRDDGQHNEARWRIEFPLFYKWMIE